jgi:hypothetical protein
MSKQDIRQGDTIRVHGLSEGSIDIPVAEVIDNKDGSVTIAPHHTPSLTDFLLARIAEDEASAREASPGPWDCDEIDDVWREDPDGQAHLVARRVTEGDAAHIARHDPARVLAECEAKRRIVGEHREQAGGGCCVCSRHEYPCPTLRYLALPYADHPDYREEWKP